MATGHAAVVFPASLQSIRCHCCGERRRRVPRKSDDPVAPFKTHVNPVDQTYQYSLELFSPRVLRLIVLPEGNSLPTMITADGASIRDDKTPYAAGGGSGVPHATQFN